MQYCLPQTAVHVKDLRVLFVSCTHYHAHRKPLSARQNAVNSATLCKSVCELCEAMSNHSLHEPKAPVQVCIQDPVSLVAVTGLLTSWLGGLEDHTNMRIPILPRMASGIPPMLGPSNQSIWDPYVCAVCWATSCC